MTIRDLQLQYANASGVAFAWIGALFGPLFLVGGYAEGSWKPFATGLALISVVGVSIYKGTNALRSGALSDVIVMLWIPMFLILVGVIAAMVLRQ